MPPLNKENALIQSLRIKDWLHLIGLPVLGIIWACKKCLFSYSSLLILIISSLYLAHGYSLNNYFDNKDNLRSNKKSISLLIFSCALLFANCVISYFLSQRIFLLVILGSLTGIMYSAVPLRLKRYLVLNLFLNSLGFCLLFLIGVVLYNHAFTFADTIMITFLGLIFVILQIVHQISHSQEDKIQQITTFYNKYGITATISFLNSIILLTVFWTLLFPISRIKSLALFSSTILLGFILSRNLKRFDICKSVEIRLFFRKAFFVYGLILLIIFYL